MAISKTIIIKLLVEDIVRHYDPIEEEDDLVRNLSGRFTGQQDDEVIFEIFSNSTWQELILPTKVRITYHD